MGPKTQRRLGGAIAVISGSLCMVAAGWRVSWGLFPRIGSLDCAACQIGIARRSGCVPAREIGQVFTVPLEFDCVAPHRACQTLFELPDPAADLQPVATMQPASVGAGRSALAGTRGSIGWVPRLRLGLPG